MKIGNIDLSKEVMVVAEIGNNHEGNFRYAEKMIKLAAESGVHAVKFQTFKTEYFISINEKKRFSQLKSYELSYTQFEKLKKIAEKCGLIFLSTPFDLDSVLFLNDIVPAFKIASGDNTFFPLIESIAKTGKPIILSSGFADMKQIKKTKEYIENIWNENKIKQDIAVLHCVSEYPVDKQNANLKAINTMKEHLSCNIGYSDHTFGLDAAIIAVALGARIIEKHFTIDKNFSSFRDHSISADPDDMKNMVNKIKQTLLMLGNGEKVAQKNELNSLPLVRRSIAAKNDIPFNRPITKDDIIWVRPLNNALPPGKEHLVIGKISKKPIYRGDPITPELLK